MLFEIFFWVSFPSEHSLSIWSRWTPAPIAISNKSWSLDTVPDGQSTCLTNTGLKIRGHKVSTKSCGKWKIKFVAGRSKWTLTAVYCSLLSTLSSCRCQLMNWRYFSLIFPFTFLNYEFWIMIAIRHKLTASISVHARRAVHLSTHRFTNSPLFISPLHQSQQFLP